MFIKKIQIENFRLFEKFEINDINVPDGSEKGSGLTVLVGDNGCGKTSLLDACAMTLLPHKADSISVNDFFKPKEKDEVVIRVVSDQNYKFEGAMPGSFYQGQGFKFIAKLRSPESSEYLPSVILHDQKYIPADGSGSLDSKAILTDESEQAGSSSPDLRVGVDNPWAGSRFSKMQCVYLDKNRVSRIRQGMHDKTSFDRLMEHFDYQYLKGDDMPIDCNEKLRQVSSDIENEFLSLAQEKISKISGEKIELSLIDNWEPHKNAFFSFGKGKKQIIPLSALGSGYEMLFSILYEFYLSQQSNKNLIVLIDEPELHMHPKLQESFIEMLLEFSQNSQIILTTHSPLFVKQVLQNNNVRVNILSKKNNQVISDKINEKVLSYWSANEINYLAFGLYTEEYHIELYERLKKKFDACEDKSSSLTQFDHGFFHQQHGEPRDYKYKGKEKQVTVHTRVRTQIHHRGDAGIADVKDLEYSIEKMREFLGAQVPAPKKVEEPLL
ncbi:MAG: ATP-binding protein [Gammaproteobacteria bacterium]|nr:ATP-binding protein [Gammaproteobacteria bacterium]